METLQIGQTKLTWLNGGDTNLDGGAMFGVVPKVLWSKKYPVNEKNQIELRTDPILVQKNGVNLLIDSGVGSGKLNEKQLRNFGVTEESSVDTSLKSLGLTPDDIDIVIMTHLHFDHASGLTMWEDAELVSAFKQAKIFTSNIEWNEMKQPNIRSKNTYWKENWEPIQNQILTFQDQIEVVEGITMFHSGGHSDGHSVVVIKDSNEIIVHMGDLMPTHAHSHVLWVLAYDDYPITSIEQKQKWLPYAQEQNAWLTFYHDAYCRAIKWNSEGEIVEKIERNRV